MSHEVSMHFHNAMRETRYAYWNALLTIDGIVISVFAASSLFSENFRWLVFIIIFVSILSCWLIISNYTTAKNVYENDIIPLNARINPQISDVELQEIDNNISAKVLDLNKDIRRNEFIIKALFIIQLILVLILSLQNLIIGQANTMPK